MRIIGEDKIIVRVNILFGKAVSCPRLQKADGQNIVIGIRYIRDIFNVS
jgi:hypothetical protein